ncbi:MAG TPA: hypothetical protein P5277_00385 [Candidatus Paceibacterota bacterium]|nr:hypothetical protein [Candidatus Paceibacterota bacterium]
MTRVLVIKSVRKIIQNKNELEKKLNIKISLKNQELSIFGSESDEFFAERVIQALDFPFTIDDALLLKDENYMFEIINIKDYTHRKDMTTIKARIIGTKGKTVDLLEELSNSIITIKDNNVAVIAEADDIKAAVQSIISLIRGSKQGNVYQYLEKARARHKRDF